MTSKTFNSSTNKTSKTDKKIRPGRQVRQVEIYLEKMKTVEQVGHLYFSWKQRPIIFTIKPKDRKTEITERQKDRKTERQKDRKTERQKDRKTERQKDRMTNYFDNQAKRQWLVYNTL